MPPNHLTTQPPHHLLLWLIRANAAILLLAAVPVFFPTELMAAMHERLGLGSFPTSQLTEYLTRSAAACYALHGGMLWLLTTDLPRYRPMIPGVYVLHLLFAATIAGIDLFAGMPTWWLTAEAGTISAVAVMVLVVNRITSTSAA